MEEGKSPLHPPEPAMPVQRKDPVPGEQGQRWQR